MTANMFPTQTVSPIFEALSTPARLQIVLAIGAGEACVCHLEAILGLRQAYISQQLMVLREKGLINSRRDGRYMHYRLRQPKILDLIAQAAHLAGVPAEGLHLPNQAPCACPNCESTNLSEEVEPAQYLAQKE